MTVDPNALSNDAVESDAPAQPRIALRGLSITYRLPGRTGRRHAVRAVDLDVAAGESVGIVGESGCGKSTMARAIGGMLPPNAELTGSLRLDGIDRSEAKESVWRDLRGRSVVMVPQGAMSGLDPMRTVEAQLVEQLTVVGSFQAAAAVERTVDLLRSVDLSSDIRRRFPHELSGGQRQRVALSLAIATDPAIVVADEPTTGLDTAVGHQVLELLQSLCRERGLALIVVSHDLAPLADRCDRLAVMYAGQLVEDAPAATIRHDAHHPYTRALVHAVPNLDVTAPWVGIPGRPPDLSEPPAGCGFAARCPLVVDRCLVEDPVGGMAGEVLVAGVGPTASPGRRVACHRADDAVPLGLPALDAPSGAVDGPPVLQIEAVSVRFCSRRANVLACDGIDLTVRSGEVVALLGPSGSGKSTLARVALGLLRPDAGSVRLGGTDLSELRGRALRRARQQAGFVHQDVYGALHPAMTVRQLVAEPLHLARTPRSTHRERIEQALKDTGLDPDAALLASLPHRLSGGQRQRVAIARAVVCDPILIVADEPTSMLDAALRAEIAGLLRRMADQRGCGVLVITHDWGEAVKLADTLVVLNQGRCTATGSSTEVLHQQSADRTGKTQPGERARSPG